jgi:hypothetical protein
MVLMIKNLRKNTLTTVVAIGAAGLGGAAIAGAASSGKSTNSAAPTAQQRGGQPPGGRHGGPGGHKPETALTGDTKQKVEDAVLAKYPNATIVRTETNTDGSAPYESHIKTADGKELEVLVSKDFAVVGANEHPARP